MSGVEGKKAVQVYYICVCVYRPFTLNWIRFDVFSVVLLLLLLLLLLFSFIISRSVFESELRFFFVFKCLIAEDSMAWRDMARHGIRLRKYIFAFGSKPITNFFINLHNARVFFS